MCYNYKLILRVIDKYLILKNVLPLPVHKVQVIANLKVKSQKQVHIQKEFQHPAYR